MARPSSAGPEAMEIYLGAIDEVEQPIEEFFDEGDFGPPEVSEGARALAAV